MIIDITQYVAAKVRHLRLDQFYAVYDIHTHHSQLSQLAILEDVCENMYEKTLHIISRILFHNQNNANQGTVAEAMEFAKDIVLSE